MAKAGETQDRCTQYALDVVSGKITAGEYVRLACQRHLDDIEKSKAAPYKYYFDVEKSEEIINFAEELTIAEGEENEHVTAYPFQCFILGSLNGWRTKEKSYRRFRTSYVQLGRQNGKSFINGILACYYGNFDGYKYGKIFCTATKQDQANIVFDEVAKFINSDEDLSEWFKVHDHNHTIDCLLTHSEIKALSGDTKSLDGHRAYLGIVDEYHAHKTNQMWFDSKKMQQYFNVEIEEKAAVAACASDYFEKYNNIPEALKGTEKENIVDAVLAELEKRNSAATQAEEQRIEAEKREILDDLYLYGM